MSNESIISPEMATRVLDANWKNVVRKVGAGKTLSTAELAIIKSRAEQNHDSVTHAKDMSDLARVLGVSRQTLYAWKRRPDAPVPGENGFHDVLAWREFIRANDLKGGMGPEPEVLKARKLLAEIEDRELKVSLKKGLYILQTEVRQQWFERIGKARSILEARLLNELPPVLAGKNPAAIRQELENAVLEFYETLNRDGGAA